MRSRILPALLIAALAAAPALAAEPKKPDANQSVDLSPVALPIVIDGRLVNYVFVTVRIVLNFGANGEALRLKEPYFRDALVRAGSRTPFIDPTDYSRLDENRLKATLLPLATAIAGPRAIRSIQVVSQTPQHHISGPRKRPIDIVP